MSAVGAVPAVLSIAGSDSSAGAGIQADLKTVSALGVYGASVITALTAQNTQGVQAVWAMEQEVILRQAEAVLEDLDVRAIKIGMLPDRAAIEAVCILLERYSKLPVVLDTVMVASAGGRLMEAEALVCFEDLIRRATLVTPNIPEIEVLVGSGPVTSRDQMLSAAKALIARGARAVLLKGGHLPGSDCADLYFDGMQREWLSAERIAAKNTHGTGCTLSSAIAAYLAHGEGLIESIRKAKGYVTEAIRHADELLVGHGRGGLHHLYRHPVWSDSAE